MMWYRILLFAVINFGALAIGGYFTGKGVPSDWYASLNKAPWTPPGWVFGAAWTTIMICFSVYMAQTTKLINKTSVLYLFGIQWILNVSWNPVFFYFHLTGVGLAIITTLTALIIYMAAHYRKQLQSHTLWILPYVIWMLIATSLNAYIFLKN